MSKPHAAQSQLTTLTHPVNPVPHPVDFNIGSLSELKTLYHELGGDYGNGCYIDD